MGKIALRQKLRSIKFSIRHKIIGVLALVAAGLWWLIEQLWSDTILGFIKQCFPSSEVVVKITKWGLNHPGEISLIIFFLTSTYLVYQIIIQTKPIENIKVTTAPSGWEYLDHGGIKITNLTGNDLKNCTVRIMRVNGKETASKLLSWGDEGIVYEPIDIPNGGSASIFLHQIFHDIKEKVENNMFVFPSKASEVELFFRGNTNTGDTKSMSIWVVLKGKVVKDEPFVTSYRAIIEHIETSLPEFGV
jgi:hypothetical protein